ncbi:MAG: hypothetical protein ACKVP2_14585 [Burkholderiales bacterium]
MIEMIGKAESFLQGGLSGDRLAKLSNGNRCAKLAPECEEAVKGMFQIHDIWRHRGNA